MEFHTLRFRVLFEHHDLDELSYTYLKGVYGIAYIYGRYEKASKKKTAATNKIKKRLNEFKEKKLISVSTCKKERKNELYVLLKITIHSRLNAQLHVDFLFPNFQMQEKCIKAEKIQTKPKSTFGRMIRWKCLAYECIFANEICSLTTFSQSPWFGFCCSLVSHF